MTDESHFPYFMKRLLNQCVLHILQSFRHPKILCATKIFVPGIELIMSVLTY